jgi:hypothetical protein
VTGESRNNGTVQPVSSAIAETGGTTMSAFQRIKRGFPRSLYFAMIPVGFALLAFGFVGMGSDEDLVRAGGELTVVSE